MRPALPLALLACAAALCACGSGSSTRSASATTTGTAAPAPAPAPATTAVTPPLSPGPEEQSPARRARQSSEWIAPPRALAQQGGRALKLFEKGRKVLFEGGCLACHRIGLLGNAHPGPNLSNVGLRLPRSVIRRVLIHPKAPMPSFRNIGEGRLRRLLGFLTQLREASQYHRGAQSPGAIGG